MIARLGRIFQTAATNAPITEIAAPISAAVRMRSYTTGDVTGMAAGIIDRTYRKTPICWCSPHAWERTGVRCRDLSPSRYPTVEFVMTASGGRNHKEEAIRWGAGRRRAGGAGGGDGG